MATTPPYLQAGNTIAIVSTARKIPREELLPAKALLESWGLKVVFGPNLFAEHHQFAGTAEQRISDLQWAIDHAEIDAILCARGGYGTVQLIDSINFDGFATKPKWVAGYSDVTVLHSHMHRNLDVETLHSTMPINFPADGVPNNATESLRKALFGEALAYEFNPHKLNRNGACNGAVVGGNLSILYSLTGTNSSMETAGKILFIEDLDEYLYHIDRMMWNLEKAGMLRDLAGLIVGGLTDMNDNAVPYGQTAQEIVRQAVDRYDYPVCFDFPAGHIDDNRALILGRSATLAVSDNGIGLNFNA